jgi:ubiquinone/menaquinone biosynthesis C-methylase UbiE
VDTNVAWGATAIQAAAQALPLRTGTVDAALAVLTIHHWTDFAAGISEMRRVARDRVIVVTWTALSSKASGY